MAGLSPTKWRKIQIVFTEIRNEAGVSTFSIPIHSVPIQCSTYDPSQSSTTREGNNNAHKKGNSLTIPIKRDHSGST